MKTLTQRDLENLREKVMINSFTQNQYENFLKLIEIVQDQQAEIELLKKQISQASPNANGGGDDNES